MRVAGLFAGIGGLELGLSANGHEANLLCEFEAGANAVLEAKFPSVKKHPDVRKLVSLPRGTELVTAGFPCQDLSQAGKTAGIAGSRSGLVGEVFRLLRKTKVPWVLLENVPFMLRLAGGKALDVIVQALEALGYRWAYRVIDSRAFGLPQRRERVFLLASLYGDPRHVLLSGDVGVPAIPSVDGKACGFYWTEGVRGLGWAVDAVPTLKGGSTIGIASPPAIWMPDGRIVKPDIRDAERMQGFTANWTKPAEKVVKKGLRWKLVGNAVTVDVAEWIGKKLRNPVEYVGAGDYALTKDSPWPRAAWNMGKGRYGSMVSAWPVQMKREPLTTFLRYDVELLSQKATSGFLSRTKVARLNFPKGFIAAIERHLGKVSSQVAA